MAEETDTAPAAAPARPVKAPTPKPAADAPAPTVSEDQVEKSAEETPVEAEADADGDPVERAVNRWFAGFNDSALSRNPEFWDLVRGRLPELITAVREA